MTEKKKPGEDIPFYRDKLPHEVEELAAQEIEGMPIQAAMNAAENAPHISAIQRRHPTKSMYEDVDEWLGKPENIGNPVHYHQQRMLYEHKALLMPLWRKLEPALARGDLEERETHAALAVAEIMTASNPRDISMPRKNLAELYNMITKHSKMEVEDKRTVDVNVRVDAMYKTLLDHMEPEKLVDGETS